MTKTEGTKKKSKTDIVIEIKYHLAIQKMYNTALT